ncbi:hypothetical protein Ae201684_005751 [Aphanomyces euteiches]|uniref:Uncharacterized protein n=1 Tax=Aphanomyces euteiches TaxID=100861 RepID=A0A6G0XDX4_9STRA|nr:hypothetical protein Ae201684_005751 [Aphanomyces euteiches]
MILSLCIFDRVSSHLSLCVSVAEHEGYRDTLIIFQDTRLVGSFAFVAIVVGVAAVKGDRGIIGFKASAPIVAARAVLFGFRTRSSATSRLTILVVVFLVLQFAANGHLQLLMAKWKMSSQWVSFLQHKYRACI